MTATTTNEKELIEMIETAKNPAKAFEYFVSIMNPNSITFKLIMLMTEKYTTVAEFAKAANMEEQTVFDIMNGKTEPTLSEVILIAKTIERDPVEIAQIFIDHFAE